MSEPLSHIYRASLPWRTDRQTECGRPAHDVASVITPDEVRGLIEAHGKTRTAFLVCQTCMNAARNYQTWEATPSAVMARHTTKALYWSGRTTDPETAQADAELHAIAALIEAHRDEFDGYLSGLKDAASLSDARAKKRAAVAGIRHPIKPIGRR